MTRFHCLKCNEDAVYVYANDGHHFGCRGRVIPIATLCNEPTVIDESDLAPGMVATLCHEFDGPHLVDPGEPIWVWAENVDVIGNHRPLEFATAEDVRFVAGGSLFLARKVTP